MGGAGNLPLVDEKDEAREESLSWRVHLLTENWKKSVGVVAFLAAICVLLYWNYESFYLPLAITLFLVTLAPFFFPTHYSLTPEGVSRRVLIFRTTRRWEEFRNFFWDREGVKLSTFSFRSRLEPFRGLFLRFGGNREEVLSYVSRYIERPQPEALEGRSGLGARTGG